MSIRLDIYRETADGLVRATYPDGFPVFAAGSANMDATQAGAERLAMECASREPGERFVVIDRSPGEETHDVMVAVEEQRAA